APIQNEDGTIHDAQIIVIGPTDDQLYFFHPDHLGSTSYVTDEDGDIHEHVEYFPFGETWYQEGGNNKVTPYLFTSKELDSETGYYYFGARYYDPRVSTWISPDPILEKYLPGRNGEKPLANGVFETGNISLYSYARNNPVLMKDPDGNWVPLILGTISAGADAYAQYKEIKAGKRAEFNIGRTLVAGATGAFGGAYLKVAAKAVQIGTMTGKQAALSTGITTSSAAILGDSVMNATEPKENRKSMQEGLSESLGNIGLSQGVSKAVKGEIKSALSSSVADNALDSFQESMSARSPSQQPNSGCDSCYRSDVEQ
ncbi:MAG: hypothetical protein OEY38_19390, partial [Gammaproteobacteria bacterium]|nr:hypothetical protein [Gammaproteobacteria bacterium]